MAQYIKDYPNVRGYSNQTSNSLPNVYASGGRKGYNTPLLTLNTTANTASVINLQPAQSTSSYPGFGNGTFFTIANLSTETIVLKASYDGGGSFPDTITPVDATTGKLAASANIGNGSYFLPSNWTVSALQFTKSASTERVFIAVCSPWILDA